MRANLCRSRAAAALHPVGRNLGLIVPEVLLRLLVGILEDRKRPTTVTIWMREDGSSSFSDGKEDTNELCADLFRYLILTTNFNLQAVASRRQELRACLSIEAASWAQ